MAVNAARHDRQYLHRVMVPAVVQCAERISSAMGFFKEHPPASNSIGDDGTTDTP
jgi:hypothetical protein